MMKIGRAIWCAIFAAAIILSQANVSLGDVMWRKETSSWEAETRYYWISINFDPTEAGFLPEFMSRLDGDFERICSEFFDLEPREIIRGTRVNVTLLLLENPPPMDNPYRNPIGDIFIFFPHGILPLEAQALRGTMANEATHQICRRFYDISSDPIRMTFEEAIATRAEIRNRYVDCMEKFGPWKLEEKKVIQQLALKMKYPPLQTICSFIRQTDEEQWGQWIIGLSLFLDDNFTATNVYRNFLYSHDSNFWVPLTFGMNLGQLESSFYRWLAN